MAVQLKGITWGHSRGFSSIVGVTQRYSEMHEGFDITWDKRSLKDFESKPISELVAEYDLLVIDHPWAGYAVQHNVLLPLNQLLPEEYLKDQDENSVGASFRSYDFDGFQSALAIDAASPVSVWRPDLIAREDVPTTFAEAVELADEGKVIYAATPIYLLMDFYGFCNTAGGKLFDESDPEHVVDKDTGVAVLRDMRRLAAGCPEVIFESDTIRLHEILSTSDRYSYCPFVYGYVNYSRRGYAAHLLKAGNIVSYGRRLLSGVLGGTGLAISASTKHPEEAAKFAMYAASGEIQSTLYVDCGGQPGHRKAWLDQECNRATLDFFKDTLQTLDASYLRPRYNGYLRFQDHAAIHIQKYVREGGNPEKVLELLDEIYVASRG